MDKDTQIQQLLEKITVLEEIIAELRADNEVLKKRLNKNSRNSSKPPSSDGLSKPPRTKSLRQQGKNKSGGQKGHKGHTLNQVKHPNKVEKNKLTHCPDCDTDLSSQPVIKSVKRQVFDIPTPELSVTEYQNEVKWCSCCRQRVRSTFPTGVNAPTQYGSTIRTWAVYFQQAQLLPEDRLQAAFADLWNVSLTTATLNRFSQRVYDELADFDETVLGIVSRADVKHLDETGFRIGSKTQWLHVASTEALTYYHVSPKRKSLLSGLQGVIVHDHWKPYYQIDTALHALCNAHHLRELTALIEHEKETWARHMKRCLQLCLHYRHKYPSAVLPFFIRKRLERMYARILQSGLTYHDNLPPLPKKGGRGRVKRRTGHNLLRRLEKYREDVLRFLYDHRVPFTNNQAERDVRMMKCKQKISGGFRTEDGAKIFVRIRGFISTARKQGWNIFESIKSVVNGQVPAIT